MICLKIIKGIDLQVNLCDAELIGKSVNGSKISENFYGVKASQEEIIQALKEATLINALGSKAVALVKKIKGELETINLNGIPHVQFFLMP